jgi:hypothetical protein
LLECVAHVVLAAATALAWLGLGTVVLAPVGRSSDAALDLVNRLAAGALGFALVTFAAGWARLLYAEAYRPLLLVFAVAGALEARRVAGTGVPRLRWPRWQLALLALIVLYALVELAVTCAPISSADALLHHAAGPELFEQRHRIVEMPWVWNSYQPYTVEMLVLDGFLGWDSVQGAFAPLMLGLAGAAATGVGAARLAGRSVGMLAATIVVCQPFTLWIFTSTFVEPALVLFIALALWNIACFVRSDAAEALVLAGLFAGAAAGTKYQGAVAAALLAAAAAFLVRDRLTWRRVAAFALPALAVSAAWYVKNAVLTGDPFYPLLRGNPNPEATRLAHESFENYGYGTSPIDLVLLPFRLLADAQPFDRGEFASPLPLLFGPLAFLAGSARRVAAVAWLAGGAYVFAWFFGSQHARFLLPLLPAFAVLAAIGMVALARRGRLGRLVTVAVTTGALVAGLGISVVYAAQFAPVVVGRESERQFLLENTSYYAATDWMNRNLPRDAHVAVTYAFVMPVDRPALVLTADVLESTAGPGATRAFVRRYGITHVAVLASDTQRKKQVRAVGGRVIARIPDARPVVSRTLSEVGPPEPVLIYELR